MRKSKVRSEGGFTLGELLTVVATVGVLTLTSIPSYNEFLVLAYQAHQIKAIQDARIAFEIGSGEIDDSDVYGQFASNHGPTATMYSGRLTPGPVRGNSGAWAPWAAHLLPGFVVGPNMRVGLRWDPNCNDGSCTLVMAYSIHCITRQHIATYWRGDGRVIEVKSKNNTYSTTSNCVNNVNP